MIDLQQQLASNLGTVQQRIKAAALRSGRQAQDVELIAVCKYVPSDITAALVSAGCQQLGESRPQQLWDKRKTLAHLSIRWHMIGHLQRNKVKRTVSSLTMLHSGDSMRLLRAVNEATSGHRERLPVLIQVNISGEASKHGFSPQEIASLLADISLLESLSVRGLMTMATLGANPDETRRDFERLRTLRDQLKTNCPDTIQLDELSMGMSGDFELAIEEGATLVRVGSALFEGISTD
jgi:hypothetical protein